MTFTTLFLIISSGALVGFFVGRWSTRRCGDFFCFARADPRCAAGNCTYHCATILGCNSRCQKVWERSDAAGDLARETMRKARVDD